MIKNNISADKMRIYRSFYIDGCTTEIVNHIAEQKFSYDELKEIVSNSKSNNKVVFTGASSESWEFQSTYTGFFTHSYAVATGYSPAKSNYFINSEDTVWVDERFGFNSNGATLWIRDTSNFSSLSNFTTWLATHNLEIYYALATPTDTEITDETLINQLNAWYNAHSLNGTTIVTSNGNLPMIIKVRGLKGE